MKYTININMAGVAAAGLIEATDNDDWAIMDYVRDWQCHPKALRVEGNKVWIDYGHLLAEMPLLKIKRAALSKRIASLRSLGLLETYQDRKSSKLYATLTEFAHSVMTFTAQNSSDTRFPQETPRFPQETPRFLQETNKYTNSSISVREEERESAQAEPVPEQAPVADATPAATPTPEKRATRLPDDFVLPTEWVGVALAMKPAWTVAHANEIGLSFADHWRSVSGQAGRKRDWLATWRNWVRNERKNPAAGAVSGYRHGGFAQRDYHAGIAADGSF